MIRVFTLLLRLVRRLPDYARISGGWHAMLSEALTVIRREGVGGFFARLGRLLGATTVNWSLARRVSPPEMRRFDRTEALRELTSLSFPKPVAPRVTVIVTVRNAFTLTVECLAALARHPQTTPFELLLVDDASTDPDIAQLASISGMHMLRNSANLGFLLSCNRAIKVARGDYVHILNNDTQVQAGWLDALVSWLDSHPDTAIAGSQLIFPDGRLQEAGVRLVRPENDEPAALVGDLIGLGDSPNEPRYQYPREVDYCSGASLLIRRSLLENLGGFDTRYTPAYFEDADLAYAARAAGYRVMYIPDSKVVHHLSATLGAHSGNDKLSLVRRNAGVFLERWGKEVLRRQSIRTIAFYLPQYHPIPENDAWWGKDFTEWTNVKKARPNFPGHDQPHIPAELGYYDLRDPQTREAQARLAREHGIDSFCYYYYWFNGKRLLEQPLDAVLSSGRPDFPFCICWANENWTRTWDGKENEVLMAQTHSPEDDADFIDSLVPYLRDRRYVRIDGRPIILLYEASLLPNPANTARIWREHCAAAGIERIYLACVHTAADPKRNIDPRVIGFDAAVEFPPLGRGVTTNPPSPLVNENFVGNCYDYEATAERCLRSITPPYTYFRGVMPAWDNTARRQDTGTIFLGSGPESYRRWLEAAVDWTARQHAGDERLVFINAWNEWGEGNHLEPDRLHGRAYLEATRTVMQRYRSPFASA